MDRYVTLVQELLELRNTSGDPVALHKTFGEPALAYPTVHIAGTNGKGSVALKIAKALEYSGHRVGLYISPHIESFRERIQINGELISREVVVSYLEDIKQKGWDTVNFFEITTMLAFLYFRDQKVDIAVIETGMGGRYDATNVVVPIVSVITTVTKDHEAQLGATLESIAYQKAGIIKQRVPVVLGYRAAYPCMFAEAFAKQAPLTILPPCKDISYSVENQCIAKEVLTHHFSLPPLAISRGLAEEQPCRFQKIEIPHFPLFIFDVAHNSDGFRRLIERLQATYPGNNYHFVFGISKDKDYDACVEQLTKVAKTVSLITPSYDKGVEKTTLQELFRRLSYEAVFTSSSAEETLQVLLHKLALPQDIIVVTGTFYIMQIVLNYLRSSQIKS